MVCAIVLLITTILTVASGATPLYCSDSPAASGSHDTDLSQVTTLQYCIIPDNCTIMRIDTGQQLDIVYTTESLLVVTPIDGNTSMVIAKMDDEMACLEYQSTTDDSRLGQFLLLLTLGLLMFLASSCILTLHLLFKELRTLFGKLLIFYSLGIMSMSSSVLTLLVTHHLIIVNSQTVCHTTMIIFIIGSASYEVFATSILTHLAYTMYRCYKLKSELSDKRSQFLFRCYLGYAFFTLVLLFFIVISYDWRTGNGRYTLLPSGHCAFVDEYSYTTLVLGDIPTTFNKVIQISMFIAYIVYYRKFNKSFDGIQTPYSRKLFKLAIAMGATIGFSQFIFIFLVLDSEIVDAIVVSSGAIILMIQLCVIAMIFLTSKQTSGLCKKLFSRDREN